MNQGVHRPATLDEMVMQLPLEMRSIIPGRRTIYDMLFTLVPFPVAATNHIAVDDGQPQMLGGKVGHVHRHPDNCEFFLVVRGLVEKLALYDTATGLWSICSNLTPGSIFMTFPGVAHSLRAAGGTTIAGYLGRRYDPTDPDMTEFPVMDITGKLLFPGAEQIVGPSPYHAWHPIQGAD